MTGPNGTLAIGLGCRKGCAAEPIVALVRRALASLEPSAMPGATCLFSAKEKRGEEGLMQAAALLALPLIFLEREALVAAAPRCQTHSKRVEALLGLPSLAEAAALAGAGDNSRLVVARISQDGASCAVALPMEAPQ